MREKQKIKKEIEKGILKFEEIKREEKMKTIFINFEKKNSFIRKHFKLFDI
jgi:hypothetical protein